jgi:hypothetical protein
MHKGATRCVASLVIVTVAIVYWPILHANFVFDDWRSFHDTSWLTQGNAWESYIFRGFNSWHLYFRPLALAFLTLQVRLFNSAPEPMHAVSLALHLIDTSLVGFLSLQLSKGSPKDMGRRPFFTGLCMLVYGLHPALTEPVAWIGCQFELLATMFMLLGLIASTHLQNCTARAITVAALFFLAACCKESAASFPFIVVIVDWASFPRSPDEEVSSTLVRFIRRNWATYVGISSAGILYLAFRYYGAGGIFNPFSANASSGFARLQEVCATYLHYWRVMLWPMPGIGPVHPVNTAQFVTVTPLSLLTDLSAIAILGLSAGYALKRASGAACLVLAVTFALLPVLHISSVDFDTSLYHERYTMTPLAIACAMLPLLWSPVPLDFRVGRLLFFSSMAVTLLWLVFAIVDVRLMLPMWSNDVNLWRWVLVTYPQNVQAKDNLLNAYIRNKDTDNIRSFGDLLLSQPAPCGYCLLLIAEEAVNEKDPTRASIALNKLAGLRLSSVDNNVLYEYYVTTGRMLILRGASSDAEHAFLQAAKIRQLDPRAQFSLAIAAALQGQENRARSLGISAISLLPLEERNQALELLNTSIDQGLKSFPYVDRSLNNDR